MENLWNKLKQSQKQQGALWLMNIVIVILCIVLFLGGIQMISALRDAFARPSRAKYMENLIRYENYANLLNSYHEDVVYGGLVTEAKKECYGVAKYFEAASMYRAYLETGDTERATREKEKMDAAYEEMGDWNIAADSIREKLGVEP